LLRIVTLLAGLVMLLEGLVVLLVS